ncbi:hypothetical protein ABBQ32_011564 [Trebouxia sp. C0010 RCD-2024]
MIPVSQTNLQSNVLFASNVLGQHTLVQRERGNIPVSSASQFCSTRLRGSSKRFDITRAVATTTEAPAREAFGDQFVREGSYESPLVELQASKSDEEQSSIAATLLAFRPGTVADVCVIGCGPAGLALSSELAKQGLSVCLIGNDVPFVNNYGVWVDEFRDLGLEQNLDRIWEDALCYFGEGKEVRIGRQYGRVCRRRLRKHLLQRCQQNGVQFLAGLMHEMETEQTSDMATAGIRLADGQVVRSRLTVVAAGAAAGKFLHYEKAAPAVAAQTAYGIEAEVEGYEDNYDAESMLFMDFRRHHTGLWPDTATRLKDHEHPAAGDGVWGSQQEVPSFLYGMPLQPGRVFLEETCLVTKPALPFAVLKRRLERRLKAMGIKVKKIHEEEWSFIPVGGPLPVAQQPITAFGAAANLVHPATGYSIARSLREAPAFAQEVASLLRKQQAVGDTAESVWDALWPQEKRRQAAFHVFGMELLAQLDIQATNNFFSTFFRLPDRYWRGFLASSLSSRQLIVFAMWMMVRAPPSIQFKLMQHMLLDPAGKYMLRTYAGLQTGKAQSGDNHAMAAMAAAIVLLAVAMSLELPHLVS